MTATVEARHLARHDTVVLATGERTVVGVEHNGDWTVRVEFADGVFLCSASHQLTVRREATA